MARSFKGSATFTVTGTYANDSTSATDDFSFVVTNTFADGTGANQAQRWWISEGRTLTALQTEDIDIFDLASTDIGGGAGADSLGQTVTMTGVKGVFVRDRSTSGGSIAVGNKNATTAWQSPFNASDTGAVTIHEGGYFVLTAPTAAGIGVTDTSDHLLTITDGGSGSTYDIGFWGID